MPRRRVRNTCTPVWNEVRTFFVFSGAHIVNDLTRPAYTTSDTRRVRISALRWACHLSMPAAVPVNPDSSCAVPNCKQTFLNRSWLAIEDSTWGTRRRFRRSWRGRKDAMSLQISLEKRGGGDIRFWNQNSALPLRDARTSECNAAYIANPRWHLPTSRRQ